MEAYNLELKTCGGGYPDTHPIVKNSLLYCPCFGFHKDYKPYYFSRKNFGGYQIILTTEGKGFVLSDNLGCTLLPGSVVLVDCNKYHEQKTLGDVWCNYNFHFDGKPAEIFAHLINSQKSTVFYPDNFTEILMEFQNGYKIPLSGDITSSVMRSDWLSRILTMILIPQKNDWYDKSIAFINNNFNNDINLDIIASVANMNKTAFVRAFKKTAMISPYQYVLRLRIQKAKALITTTSIPFDKIAEKSGFSSITAFYRIFFKQTGYTPGEFRERNGV